MISPGLPQWIVERGLLTEKQLEEDNKKLIHKSHSAHAHRDIGYVLAADKTKAAEDYDCLLND